MARANEGKPSKREARLAEKRRKRTLLTIAGVAAAVLVLAGLVYAFAEASRAPTLMGEAVTGLTRDHVPDGTDPGPYATNPPAGGNHYAESLQAGFYDEAAAANVSNFQEGYLVHSLEHGYVIYWYNCEADPSLNCEDIKQSIRDVMAANQNYKVIGFPWPSMDAPLVMTSWGRIMTLDEPDKSKMRAFYQANLNKAPESNAD